MNKADFISKLAVEMNISQQQQQQQSRQFMKAFQVVLTEAMKQDSPVMLQGFGTFTPWSQKERIGRNPHTGISCAIPARISVKFKPGKFLLRDLNPSK